MKDGDQPVTKSSKRCSYSDSSIPRLRTEEAQSTSRVSGSGGDAGVPLISVSSPPSLPGSRIYHLQDQTVTARFSDRTAGRARSAQTTCNDPRIRPQQIFPVELPAPPHRGRTWRRSEATAQAATGAERMGQVSSAGLIVWSLTCAGVGSEGRTAD